MTPAFAEPTLNSEHQITRNPKKLFRSLGLDWPLTGELQAVTKILILASHDAFGEQLKMFIRDQFHCSIAGVATTSAAGLELARTTKPDVVLADVGLDGNRGIDWVKKYI